MKKKTHPYEMSQARRSCKAIIKMWSHFKAKLQGRSKKINAFPEEMRFWVIFLNKLVLKQLIICISDVNRATYMK